MASRDRELKVVVLGDATSAQRALGKLDSSVDKTGRNVEKAQSKLSKFGSVFAGGAAAAGLARFGRDALAAAEEARKVAAQTDAVIKSTGGAAGVSADQIAKLSGQLKKLSGVEDEAIQSGANMLLTFTNLRNEAGAGNDVFDQATRTLLDMSVALGTDAKTSAIQLGKALNDPIAGIGALSRVGVTFTEDQKKMIRALVESGDVMGAQKIILAELNKEFGGSAAAAGAALDPLEKLRNRFDDFQEVAGGEIIKFLVDFEYTIGAIGRRVDELSNLLDKLSKWEAKGPLGAILDVAKAAKAAGDTVVDIGNIAPPGKGINTSGSDFARRRAGMPATESRGDTTNVTNNTNNTTIHTTNADPVEIDRAIARGWRHRARSR